MTHDYSEEQIVELPAIELFGALGWGTLSAIDEVFGAGGTLGRETPGDVVLLARLRPALVKLNPDLPPEAIDAAVVELTRDRAAMDPAAANREIYRLLKEGVPVSVPNREGGQEPRRATVIDWENPANNNFLAVRQMTFAGPLYTCRPDIVGFVNGLPLVVIEFKKPGVPPQQAFEQNLTSYKHAQNGVAALFWYNALLIA
ncbi:type I restriction endonuclease subunit R, partial [Nitrospirales bacterium NOB]|nr:type I restriction endonuclease subunit R [Nitrospirales bacterium NOB]